MQRQRRVSHKREASRLLLPIARPSPLNRDSFTGSSAGVDPTYEDYEDAIIRIEYDGADLPAGCTPSFLDAVAAALR